MSELKHMAAEIRTAHIVNNSEVGITECGLLIGEAPQRTDDGWETGPFSMGKGRNDVAIWDDFTIPQWHLTCIACTRAYESEFGTATEIGGPR